MATLLDFAIANDAAAATPKKLAKQAALAAYFQTLPEHDLRLAARYAAGRPFAATDERVLSVGGALLRDVLVDLLGLDEHAYHDLVVRSGETGEALRTAWNLPAPAQPAPLHLQDLAAAFDALAATGTAARKRDLLRRLFQRCTDPREAAYLAKVISGDLRTGVQDGVLQAAIAEAFARPLPDVQRCHLLVGDLDEVAVLAQANALDSAAFRLFHPVQFMLATPQETADEAASTLAGRPFFAEDKLDGIRAQVHKSADRIAIYTRTMDRTDASFPDVVASLRHLPGDFLLDGEIVPYRDGQVLPFAHIQKRLGRKALGPKVLAENPCAFIAFDILYLNGSLLMDAPLTRRRQALEELSARPSPQPPLPITRVTPVATADDINAAFCSARDCRNEGLVLKDPASPYSPGRRGKMWLKLKTHLPTLDCVVTAAETGRGKRRNSLSDYTFAVWDRPPTDDDARLVNVGKAYIGVTDAEIAQLTDLFTNITISQFGRVRQVKPQLVLEIACDQIQKSARHASGYALRFPRIKRIRWDKSPADADRLARVAELYESAANFGRQLATAPTPEPTLFDGLS